MPSIGDHGSSAITKTLLLGHGGAGKTGLIASLARRYKLFIADFDNGLDIFLDPKVLPPEFRKNVYYKTFYDQVNIVGGKPIHAATSIPEFTAAIGGWREGSDNLGNIYTWGSNTVFVLDSLTFFGDAALRNAQGIAGRLGQRPQIQDYGAAVDTVETTIEMLYNPAVKCHVIVTAHLVPMNDQTSGNVIKLLPSAIGNKLPPKIGRYFNNVVLVEKSGSGNAVQRRLHTTALHNTDLKVSKPSLVPPVMEPDLDKLFTLLQGETPTANASTGEKPKPTAPNANTNASTQTTAANSTSASQSGLWTPKT